ncbi:MAG TPA: DUF6531 domain-containing protein, partial [Solirubrobacterales bacterium]|nr:DUF6531 domain-containing protein [Solirubrobacterales bacterium]
MHALAVLALLLVGGSVMPTSTLASPPGNAFRFFHDADGRLKAAIDPEGDTAVYGWDAAGNLLSISRHASSKLSVIQMRPAKGDVGATVMIEGTGFSAIPASNTVKFNGTAATVSAATSTSLTTKVPVGATTGSVTVSTAEEGPVASPESFTVAESSAPHISTLSSSVAVAEEEITASGSNFEPMIAGNSLTLSLARPEMTSASASAIKFKVPTGTLGGRVSVATPEGSSAGPDLYIPPNGLATSKVGSTARFSLDETKSVSFAGSEKVTLVLFDGTAGQRVSLKLSESTLSSGVASLFSPVGDEVQGASFTSSGGGLVGPVTLPTTGTYTVLLSPSVAGSGSVKLSTYSFEDITGSISPPATAEGTQKSVSIATPGQEARYSVAGTAGEVVSLKTSSSAMSGEYSLEWLDPEGKVLKSWSSGGSENGFKGVVSFPATGTYTLAVNPKSWHTGSVTLTAWDASSATASLTPSASGDSKTMTISVPGQAALVTFSGTAGQRLSAVLSEITLSGGWTSLKRPTGKELEEGPISKGASKMYGPLTLPETGTYTITIVGSGENTGSVKVTGYAFEDVTGSISPPATAEGTQKSVSIATPGQEARYSVAGTTGEVVSLKRSSSAMSGSYQLEWLDPEGKVLKSWSSGGSENGFLGGVAFPSSGTYTLAVNPESTYTGSVTLTAWDATSASGSISPSGTGNSKTMTTTVPGQGALVTFAGTAGQQVSVDLSEITFSSGWASLKRPTGKELAEGSLSKGSTRTLGPVTLPETGTYTITIAPSGESTGSVKATGYLIENITGSISPSTSAEGSQQSLTIVAPGQEARYSVEIAAGEAVSLKTSSSTFNGRYYLEWINPSGKVVSSTSWKGSEGGYWLHQEFASAGTYTLAVNPEGSTTGSVTLTAWDASIYDAGSITPTAEGSSKVLSVNVPGGVTKIVFGGTSGQQLRFDFSEITFSGYMAIKTPAGSTLSGGETALPKGGSKSLKPGVLPSTGSYTIWFIPQFQNGETGSAKMTAVLESPVAWLSDPEPRMVLASFEGIAPRGPYPDGAGPRRAAYFHPELVSRSSHPSGMPSPADPRSRGHDRLRGRKSRRASGWRRNDRGNARLALHRGSTTLQRSGGSITRAMRQFSPGAVAVWHPPRNVPGWEAAEPKSPWAEMEDLQAPAGTTALAGQALERNGLPVAGVRVFVEGTSVEATTDEAGRFLLSGAPAGHQTLVINGESVPGDRRYGSYEVSVDLANHETTALDYTIWLSPLDSDGNRQIASPTEHETSLTTPSIPGLEVRIPAGTMIRNAAGKMVRDLNITAIPVNQAPFPLPPFVPIPVYFTIQPGRAYLSKGAQIVYPNWGDLRPGQRAEFWNYDPKDRGWYVYGRGTVSADGKQVVPDPGVRVWQFTGAMLASSPLPPEAGPTGVSSGDPVDLYSGLFTYHKRDLSLPDTLPIDVQRTYRPADSNSYSFGLGTTNQYDLRLWSGAGAAEANLIMPDGQRIHYVRTSPGTGYSDGVYKSTSTPGPFYASTLKYNPSGGGAYWNL